MFSCEKLICQNETRIDPQNGPLGIIDGELLILANWRVQGTVVPGFRSIARAADTPRNRLMGQLGRFFID